MKVSVENIHKNKHSECQNCTVCTPPNKTPPDKAPPDKTPLWDVQTAHRHLSDMGFTNIKDSIIYEHEKNGNNSDVTETKETSADYSFLCASIDRCLWCYMELQAKLNDTILTPFPLYVSDRLDIYSHKTGISQKEIYLSFPRKTSDGRQSSLFANNAYTDIICKQLFVRTNATTKVSSPQYMCTFFGRNQLPELRAKNPDQSKDLSFTLEDYIFYEMVTGVSLCVESCAALSLVENPGIRNVCLEILKKNFSVLLTSHYLFGRIAFMRQFIMNASVQIEGTLKFQSQSDTVEREAQLDIAQKIWNSMIYDWQCRPMPVACCTQNMEDPPDRITGCRDTLLTMINCVKAPVNLSQYIQNPLYGPAAFCNPNHPGIIPFLSDLEYYNKGTNDTHIPERWKPFLQLCEATQVLRRSQNTNERERMKFLRKLFRSRPNKRKYTSKKNKNNSSTQTE